MIGLEVAVGSAHDVRPLHRLRKELEAWLRARGVDQWQSGGPSEHDIAVQVADREWHVVRDLDLQIIAALRILRADPEFWGDDTTPAAYVHGLMVARQEAGRGVGTALLDWVCARSRADGAQVVRLDCGESNTSLRAYYRANGFTEVGRRDFERFAVILFEKRLFEGPCGLRQ